MENFVKIFKSSKGDAYNITLSEDYSVLSSQIKEALGDIRIVGIELRRLAGRHATGQEVLVAFEETIADFFFQNENVIICYYCDFINPIPHTKKNKMPSQEYRSRLFDLMFQRYAKQHRIHDVRLSVVEITGINETYYFHVIYRESHSVLAALIGSDLREGFGK